MSLSSSLIYFVIITTAVIFGDILCDVTGQLSQNPWQLGNNNRNGPAVGSQIGPNPKSTTPWPSLGRQNNRQNVKQAPLWIRANNGPNWVRNTPAPQPNVNRNNAVNSRRENGNTIFLNNERGGSAWGGGLSGGPSMAVAGRFQGTNKNTAPAPTPVQGMGNNRGATSSPPLRQNSNNRAAGVISSGSMVRGGGNVEDLNAAGGGGGQASEVTDNELREFSEELLNKDNNNANAYVTLNLQGMTTSRSMADLAPLPLLSIDHAAYSIPSISKLMLLYNNYILKANENEVYTAQEKAEENDLLDTILSTSVMQHARNFLIKKGKLGRDPKEFKDLLRLIWFNMYSRGGGRIGSSGFEHVFLAEIKNNQVSGLHNWVYFHEEEKKNNANYLGYMRKLDLGNKGAIVKYHFNFHNIDKPVGGMFVGTSPELEMAIYSTCFVLRADKICPLKMNGNRFVVRTYTYRYRGKSMIGSAFPEI